MGWLRHLFTGSRAPAGAQEACLRKGYELAYGLLKLEGAFPPIAIGVSATGDQSLCVSEDGQPGSVQEWLREGVSRRGFVEVYLFCMVELRPEAPSPGFREGLQAVGVYIDRPGPAASCEVVLTPYTLESRELHLGTPDVSQTTDRVLA